MNGAGGSRWRRVLDIIMHIRALPKCLAGVGPLDALLHRTLCREARARFLAHPTIKVTASSVDVGL